MLWLQHRADRWYLVGRVSNEMDQHLCRPGNCCESLFRLRKTMASERLQAITWNGTQTSLTASSCKTGLTSHFYGANKASELPLVPMSGTRPPPSTIGASARRPVPDSSKSEGGKRADPSTRNVRDGGAARSA